MIMMTFEDISTQVNALKGQIAVLREAGARAAADEQKSGHEILTWLTRNGMTDIAARQLVATIVRERRAARQTEVKL